MSHKSYMRSAYRKGPSSCCSYEGFSTPPTPIGHGANGTHSQPTNSCSAGYNLTCNDPSISDPNQPTNSCSAGHNLTCNDSTLACYPGFRGASISSGKPSGPGFLKANRLTKLKNSKYLKYPINNDYFDCTVSNGKTAQKDGCAAIYESITANGDYAREYMIGVYSPKSQKYTSDDEPGL